MTEKLPSLPSDVLAEVFHLSHLQAFFVCNSVLPAYLKYLSKTSALEDVDFAFNAFIHLLCLAAYIKTGITSGLEPDLGAVTAPDLFQSQEFLPCFNYSIVDVLCPSTLFGNCTSQKHKSINVLYSLPIHFHCIVVSRIIRSSLHLSTLTFSPPFLLHGSA